MLKPFKQPLTISDTSTVSWSGKNKNVWLQNDLKQIPCVIKDWSLKDTTKKKIKSDLFWQKKIDKQPPCSLIFKLWIKFYFY
jgi:hypothetical protein